MASLEADEEKEVIAGFNRLRDEEYREVIEGCEELLREIVKETKAEKFYFAELEELEKDLQKLKEWSAAVIQRDFFGAGLRDDVSRLMIECEDKFNNFSQQVLACEEPTVREGETGVAGPQLRRELKRIKQKEKQVYTKGELIAKLKEVLSKLENETLTVGEEQVDALPESVTLELEYKGHEGSKTLEIELKWQ
ncbi:MAG: hypothetical protein HY665_03125 [Chloroflexi bacterium]|nr:hypothetical protein [Chloroflexota bacterium]